MGYMPRLAPDPPLRDDVIALRGFESGDASAPVEIFARRRGAAGG